MAGLHMVAGLALLRPEEQVFAAMLEGRGSQQVARNLPAGTVQGRQRVVRPFATHAAAYPCRVDAPDGRRVARRPGVLCPDPDYDWPQQCQRRFGTHPVQVVHEWNAAVHAQQAEPTRPLWPSCKPSLTRRTPRSPASAPSAARTPLPAFRDAVLLDAVLFKVAYAYGLRRNQR
jgi:hypothetical protein